MRLFNPLFCIPFLVTLPVAAEDYSATPTPVPTPSLAVVATPTDSPSSPDISLDASGLVTMEDTVAVSTSSTCSSASTGLLIVQVVDTNGGGVGGVHVSLSKNEGGSATITALSDTTDDYGTATFTVTNTVPETNTFEAEVAGVRLLTKPSVTFTNDLDEDSTCPCTSPTPTASGTPITLATPTLSGTPVPTQDLTPSFFRTNSLNRL